MNLGPSRRFSFLCFFTMTFFFSVYGPFGSELSKILGIDKYTPNFSPTPHLSPLLIKKGQHQ